MDSISEITKDLNPRQLEAVEKTEGYVRVIAGAGSGKTKALTSRYAYIVKALGISSSNILCVTFTNKAAQEIRQRIRALVGHDADLGYITTYHGFCVKILREDINKLSYPKGFLILDTEDQKALLRTVYGELGLSSKNFTFKEVISYIGTCKGNDSSYIDYLLEPKTLDYPDVLKKIFYRYLDLQLKNFALDYDDLILFALRILISHEDVLNKWQKRLHYIQVDEMQDSSKRQFALIRLLSGYHQNLFVVGDPDQTIYEWRGAKPELLVEFDQRFENTQTVIMNQNYRSTPNILDLGNDLIKKNQIRVDKDLFTENGAGVDVVHFHGKTEFEESLWVASTIKKLTSEQGCKYSDIAILYRATHVSRNFEQSFVKEGIPYSIFGGIRFFERKEIKDSLSYLRLIEVGDDISLLRVINAPSRGLGKKYIELLTNTAAEQNLSLYEALHINIDAEGFNRKGAVAFVELIERLRSIRSTLSISDLLQLALKDSGLLEFYRRDGDEERLDNIKELQDSIIQQEQSDEEPPCLSEYLQEIALYTDMDKESSANDKVRLMTIHTAKGLEFPHVFVVGFSEGILPNERSLKERREEALEEERRLAYVAITRAEISLYLTESEGFNHATGSAKLPSRFLWEIKKTLFISEGVLSADLIEQSRRYVEGEPKEKELAEVFKKGDRVAHPIFGEGEVVSVSLKRQEMDIAFAESGKIKPISAEFKGLTLLSREQPIEEALPPERRNLFKRIFGLR